MSKDLVVLNATAEAALVPGRLSPEAALNLRIKAASQRTLVRYDSPAINLILSPALCRQGHTITEGWLCWRGDVADLVCIDLPPLCNLLLTAIDHAIATRQKKLMKGLYGFWLDYVPASWRAVTVMRGLTTRRGQPLRIVLRSDEVIADLKKTRKIWKHAYEAPLISACLSAYPHIPGLAIPALATMLRQWEESTHSHKIAFANSRFISEVDGGYDALLLTNAIVNDMWQRFKSSAVHGLTNPLACQMARTHALQQLVQWQIQLIETIESLK